MAKLKRISDFAKLEDVRPPLEKASDFLGVELVIHSVEWKEGTFGEYGVVTCSRLEGTADETFAISCGGELVVKQLHLCEQQGFPMGAKFLKSGRQLYME